MRSLSYISAAAVVSFFLICPGTSLAGITKTTDAKHYRLEIELKPSQPVVGGNAAVLTVTDVKSNRTVNDAIIEVIPWMTMHGHGSSKKPAVKKAEGGHYQVENLYYTMEGDWDLIITIQNNGATDTVTIPIQNVKKK